MSDPTKNKKAWLKAKTKELGKLSEQDLAKLAQKALKEINQISVKKDEMTKAKYWVS